MSNSINLYHNIHVPDGRGAGSSNVCERLVVLGGAVAKQSGPVGVLSVANLFGFSGMYCQRRTQPQGTPRR